MNPYDVLGLERDATPDEIRRKYHRCAKTAHPDVGGKPEDWERLNLAYTLLSDPEARKKYDATGDVTLGQCDNALAETLAVISHAVEQIRERAQAMHTSLRSIDWIAAIRQQLKIDQRLRHEELAGLERMVEALRGRFVRLQTLTEPTASVDMLALVCSHYETMAAHLKKSIEQFDRATERALKEMEFYADRDAPRIAQPFKYPFDSHPH